MGEEKFKIALTLLKACKDPKANSRNFGTFMKVAECKKALSGILEIIGDGNDVDRKKLIRRLSTKNSRMSDSEYTMIKKILHESMKKEFGITRVMLVIGETKSNIGLSTILHDLLALVECTQTQCRIGKYSKKRVECIVSECSKLIIICLQLSSDLYTKFPCYKGFEKECAIGLAKFAEETATLITKIEQRKLTPLDLEDITTKLRVLMSIAFKNT
jgi:hypothetical protein